MSVEGARNGFNQSMKSYMGALEKFPNHEDYKFLYKCCIDVQHRVPVNQITSFVTDKQSMTLFYTTYIMPVRDQYLNMPETPITRRAKHDIVSALNSLTEDLMKAF